jgi:flagellar protein FlaF
MSIFAYKRTITRTESPRQIERRLLAKTTADLEKHYRDFDTTEDRSEKLKMLAEGLRHTLWENQSVWATFKMDLMEKENSLNAELRGSLISLAIWVERHTQGVLAGQRAIKPLVDINHSIISGLSGSELARAAE